MEPVTIDTSRAPKVSVIVPARNEEQRIARCLASLCQQEGFGGDGGFEVIIVNDHSTDATSERAASFDGVQVVTADPLPEHWSGKCNACRTGAQHARGDWFLFTDADTVHSATSISQALNEAEETGSALLSYSPEQEVRGFWERAVMPLVFADLACTFRPSDVCDPALPAAAANGQFLLISRAAYAAVGGHAAVATEILEDVALASLVKQSGRRIRFRIGTGIVRTRMYRGLREMSEGWTKNLALLFPNPDKLARARIFEFDFSVGLLLLALVELAFGYRFIALGLGAVALITFAHIYLRVHKAHFDILSTLISPLGLPVYAYLLRRSRLCHQQGSVRWKGRTYSGAHASGIETGVAKKV
jgi:glycosyltransferase involved in cell wall biosynthesis